MKCQIDTFYWDDPFISELEPSSKLIYLYLFTNSLKNMIGIYEITDRKISFDTGCNLNMVAGVLKELQNSGKIARHGNIIAIRNHVSSQNPNYNMIKGMINQYSEVPEQLIRDCKVIQHIGYSIYLKASDSKDFEPFQTLMNTSKHFEVLYYILLDSIRLDLDFNVSLPNGSKGLKKLSEDKEEL